MDNTLFFVVIIGIVITIFIIAYVLDRKRTEQFEAIANEWGFTFYPSGNQQILGLGQNFALFNKGRSRNVRRLMQGHRGDAWVSIFDYSYTTGHGKHSHTHTQTVMLFQSSALNLPRFSLGPEGFFDKIGAIFGRRDINFEEYPQFSDRYFLQGDDEDRIRQVFTPRVLEFYQTIPNLCTEAEDTQLVIYRNGSPINPDALEGHLDSNLQIFEMFKKYI